MATLQFDGVDDNVRFTGGTSLIGISQNAEDFTAVFLANRNGDTSTLGRMAWAVWDDADATRRWKPGHGFKTNLIWMDDNTAGRGSTENYSGSTSWILAAFHVKRTTTASMTIRARNITTDAAVATSTPAAPSGTPSEVGGNGRLAIGCASSSTASNGDFFSGYIGLVACWDNVILTAGQFDELYANKRTSDLWKCSAGTPTFLVECDTTTLVDLAGAVTTPTITGATLTGPDPTGWTFDGTGAAVTPPLAMAPLSH